VNSLSEQMISPAAVRAQVENMCGSKTFAKSPRLRSFLRFTVEQTLQGQQDGLKEYLLGVEVFGKPRNFDPRLDSIVRVEARRLRAKVDRYYSSEGLPDDLRIVFYRGEYVPHFFPRSAEQAETPGDSVQQTKRPVLVIGSNTEQASRLVLDLIGLGYEAATATTSAEQFARIAGKRASGLVVMEMVPGQEEVSAATAGSSAAPFSLNPVSQQSE
jgi:hypothetical protein